MCNWAGKATEDFRLLHIQDYKWQLLLKYFISVKAKEILSLSITESFSRGTRLSLLEGQFQVVDFMKMDVIWITLLFIQDTSQPPLIIVVWKLIPTPNWPVQCYHLVQVEINQLKCL